MKKVKLSDLLVYIAFGLVIVVAVVLYFHEEKEYSYVLESETSILTTDGIKVEIPWRMHYKVNGISSKNSLSEHEMFLRKTMDTSIQGNHHNRYTFEELFTIFRDEPLLPSYQHITLNYINVDTVFRHQPLSVMENRQNKEKIEEYINSFKTNNHDGN